MNKIIKVASILIFAGFSFFYTEKVTTIIKENDPIMKKIHEKEKEITVSKIEPIVMNDEYITGINGCKIDVSKSYNKMKNDGSYKEELIVFTEDEVGSYDKYIVGGNKENRKVSIIFLNLLNKNLNDYFKEKNIKINYFFDGEFINDNIDILKEVRNYSRIYNYGRNNNYDSKYLTYDNYIIKKYFNESNYCLVTEKNDKKIDICNSYKMKTIKTNLIIDNYYNYIKENLSNGKIFLIDKINNNEGKVIMNYILSKGYEIVYLDELLNTKKECN